MTDPIRRAHDRIRELGLGRHVRTGTSRQRNRRRPHVHDRGVILPDGSRGCWRCYVAARLGVRP